MKNRKEDPRSLRLTTEALNAMKIHITDNPDKSQGDFASEAIVNYAKKTEATPAVRFNCLDPQQFQFLQVESAQAERRLREFRRMLERSRPNNNEQAAKAAELLSKIGKEIDTYGEFRNSLAQLARSNADLSAADIPIIQAGLVQVQMQIESMKAKGSSKTIAIQFNTLIIRLFRSLLPFAEKEIQQNSQVQTKSPLDLATDNSTTNQHGPEFSRLDSTRNVHP